MNRSGNLIYTPLDEETARQLSYRDDVRALNHVELAAATNSDAANGRYGAGDRDAAGNVHSSTETGRQAEARTGTEMGQQVTISGSVESVMGAAVGTPPMAADVLMFRLKADSGVSINVDAGSQAAFTRQSLTLRQGDKVTVTGHKMAARANDRGSSAATSDDVIMAQSIQMGSRTVVIERSSHDHTQSANPDKDDQQQKSNQ